MRCGLCLPDQAQGAMRSPDGGAIIDGAISPLIGGVDMGELIIGAVDIGAVDIGAVDIGAVMLGFGAGFVLSHPLSRSAAAAAMPATPTVIVVPERKLVMITPSGDTGEIRALDMRPDSYSVQRRGRIGLNLLGGQSKPAFASNYLL